MSLWGDKQIRFIYQTRSNAALCACVCGEGIKAEQGGKNRRAESFKGDLFCPFNLNTFPSAAADCATACSTIR